MFVSAARQFHPLMSVVVVTINQRPVTHSLTLEHRSDTRATSNHSDLLHLVIYNIVPLVCNAKCAPSLVVQMPFRTFHEHCVAELHTVQMLTHLAT